MSMHKCQVPIVKNECDWNWNMVVGRTLHLPTFYSLWNHISLPSIEFTPCARSSMNAIATDKWKKRTRKSERKYPQNAFHADLHAEQTPYAVYKQINKQTNRKSNTRDKQKRASCCGFPCTLNINIYMCMHGFKRHCTHSNIQIQTGVCSSTHKHIHRRNGKTSEHNSWIIVTFKCELCARCFQIQKIYVRRCAFFNISFSSSSSLFLRRIYCVLFLRHHRLYFFFHSLTLSTHWKLSNFGMARS